jgi:hypothetical protein
MKKIRFQWDDISQIKHGRDPKLAQAMPNISDSYELSFLNFTINRRGTVNLLFKSTELRNSAALAMGNLSVNRQRDEEQACSSCGASETFEKP